MMIRAPRTGCVISYHRIKPRTVGPLIMTASRRWPNARGRISIEGVIFKFQHSDGVAFFFALDLCVTGLEGSDRLVLPIQFSLCRFEFIVSLQLPYKSSHYLNSAFSPGSCFILDLASTHSRCCLSLHLQPQRHTLSASQLFKFPSQLHKLDAISQRSGHPTDVRQALPRDSDKVVRVSSYAPHKSANRTVRMQDR